MKEFYSIFSKSRNKIFSDKPRNDFHMLDFLPFELLFTVAEFKEFEPWHEFKL